MNALDDTNGLYIQQVADMLGLSTSVVRRWEAHGIVIPKRSPSGFRVYDGEDIARLRRARDLIRGDGLNVTGALRVLEEEKEGPGSAQRRAQKQGTVGARLRALRQQSGRSLRDVAELTGLSASYVSAVERSLSHPSVAALQKLCAALGSNLVEVLGGEDAEADQLVIRRDERRILDLDIPGVEITELAPADTPLEPLLFRLAPGATSGDYYQHGGDEFLHVLAGRFQIVLEETTEYVLEQGDSITFSSLRPHRWSNPDDEVECLVLWVNTPRTF